MADNTTLSRDLYILEDESNPTSSKANNIWPSTILDQVYDQLTPNKKTLRTILEELHQDIISGGVGNIVFPVTSVNDMTGDIHITKDHLGLTNVDNTSDLDKPLSDPQRAAIMNIIEHYEFQPDLSDLYNHILDCNNPHAVTLEQINRDDSVKHYVIQLIENHNRMENAHPDIRALLENVQGLAAEFDTNFSTRIDAAMDAITDHMVSPVAHSTLFDTKEDKINKASTFSTVDHVKYPTVRAVVDYVSSRLDNFQYTLYEQRSSIVDVLVINSRDELPEATTNAMHKVYFIQNGADCSNEIAMCRYSDDGTYFWDINAIDILPNFNQSQFYRTIDGISVNTDGLVSNDELENFVSKSELENILYGES